MIQYANVLKYVFRLQSIGVLVWEIIDSVATISQE